MPINVQTESIVSLTEATKLLPRRNGKRAAISTVWRWCRKGIKGVRLEYIRVGRNIATSREALNRFYEALAQADRLSEQSPELSIPKPDWPQTDAARRASLEAADRVLERAGIRRPAGTIGGAR
jgi:hypothetical protein